VPNCGLQGEKKGLALSELLDWRDSNGFPRFGAPSWSKAAICSDSATKSAKSTFSLRDVIYFLFIFLDRQSLTQDVSADSVAVSIQKTWQLGQFRSVRSDTQRRRLLTAEQVVQRDRRLRGLQLGPLGFECSISL